MENKTEKEVKLTRIITVLVVIIVALIFVAGYALGTKKNDKSTLSNNESVEMKPAEEKEENVEEQKDDTPTEKKEESNENKTTEKEEKKNNSTKSNEELSKEAYRIVTAGYSIAPYLYTGKKVELTKLPAGIKMGWILAALPSKYDIPICTEKTLAMTEKEIKDYSLFQDTGFINTLKKNSDNAYDGTTYYAEYKNSKFYVADSNCDGEGPGLNAFGEYAYDSYKVDGDRLYLTVRFGYFDYDWDNTDVDNEKYAYVISDSYSDNAQKIGKQTVQGDEIVLNDSNSVKYQFVFKIVGDKLYPLTVNKI